MGGIEVKVQFPYRYLSEMSDHDGPTYSCKYGSKEQFLEAFKMKDLGPVEGIFSLAEQVIDIPLNGLLPPVSLDESNIVDVCGETVLFDEKYKAVKMIVKKPGGAASDEHYFFLWVGERKEWVCIKEDFDYLWEAGPFNERMVGPYSCKSLEKRLAGLLEEKHGG